MRAALVCLIHPVCLTALLAGCGDSPPETPPAPPTAAAEKKAEAAPPDDPAAREARYAARPTVELPAELPPAWRTWARSLDGRITEAAHEVRSHPGRKAWRRIALTVRVFDHDAAVQTRVRAGLEKLDLPGLPPAPGTKAFWRGEPVEAGDVTWSIDIGRLVAPAGTRREHIVTLEWQRTPPPPEEARDCRKPPPVEAPALAPGWLKSTTSKRTTRRRVSAGVKLDRKGTTVETRMLFRNGYAHDEHVGHLAAAAEKAGFTRKSGSGPTQSWTRDDGATLRFEPDNDPELHLGCTLAGPVIAARLHRPR